MTQRQLRNGSGQIMRALDAGEEFVVTRNGVPVGELRPLHGHGFIAREALLAAFRNAPAIDAKQFRADLDAPADQDAEPLE